MAHPDFPDWHERRLYAIVDLGYVKAEEALEAARSLLAGGADVVQLRAKGQPPEMIAELASELAPLCRAAGVPFILNDFPEIAAACGAAGVHLGQDDGTLAGARAICGPDFIYGRSTHSPAQARAALAEGFDYIGFGPLFPTPTKPGRPAVGLADLASVQATVGSHIPVFAIGGISHANLEVVRLAGAARVVIVSALLTAPDISAATRLARRLL